MMTCVVMTFVMFYVVMACDDLWSAVLRSDGCVGDFMIVLFHCFHCQHRIVGFRSL